MLQLSDPATFTTPSTPLGTPRNQPESQLEQEQKYHILPDQTVLLLDLSSF